MDGQTGFQSNENFSQGGFQKAEDQKSAGQTGFSQGGFQKVKDDSTPSHSGLQQTGFQPSDDFNSTGFQSSSENQGNKGFQPPGKTQTRVDSDNLVALKAAIQEAKSGIAKAEELMHKLEFLPQSSTAFD